MKISLDSTKLFKENEFELNRHIYYVYGKNGSGKSTFAKLIAEQMSDDSDVRVFDGFDNIVGANRRLNAVVLGEKNKKIDDQVEKLRREIENKMAEKEKIMQTISKPDDNSDNLWTDWNEKENNRKKLEKAIETFYTSSAAELKKKSNLQIVSPGYNKKNFEQDIANAALLQDVEVERQENILKSTVKTARKVVFPEADPEQLLKEVNKILSKRVVEKHRVVRLENQEKINFAKQGMEIHNKGDICAFCGNKISDEVFEELESYFAADEVKAFQDEIQTKKAEIEAILEEVKACEIYPDDFYPSFEDRVNKLFDQLKAIHKKQNEFLTELIDALNKKAAELFIESNELEVDIPESYATVKEEYEKLMNENNEDKLDVQQTVAKEKLKLHYIKLMLDDFQFDVKEQEVKDARKTAEKAKEKIDHESEKIYGVGGIERQINELSTRIDELLEETQNEEKLAEHVNKKLKHMVSFELVAQKNEKGEGYYSIKSLIDGSIRNIDKISTGEKNIIAFLYFVEKLNEVSAVSSTLRNRIIIFDDPMNSNDDNMQYLIMEKLLEIADMVKNKENEWFFLLTHNKHFYINVTHDRDRKAECYFFNTDGMTTSIEKIEKENDIKTSYASLWHELRYLYSNPDVPEYMLINPIRRILETFYRFNEIKPNVFYDGMFEARKLFNVNSHSIDDLEAELNGKSKDQIIQLMRRCFENNSAVAHFESYWDTERSEDEV